MPDQYFLVADSAEAAKYTCIYRIDRRMEIMGCNQNYIDNNSW